MKAKLNLWNAAASGLLLFALNPCQTQPFTGEKMQPLVERGREWFLNAKKNDNRFFFVIIPILSVFLSVFLIASCFICIVLPFEPNDPARIAGLIIQTIK